MKNYEMEDCPFRLDPPIPFPDFVRDQLSRPYNPMRAVSRSDIAALPTLTPRMSSYAGQIFAHVKLALEQRRIRVFHIHADDFSLEWAHAFQDRKATFEWLTVKGRWDASGEQVIILPKRENPHAVLRKGEEMTRGVIPVERGISPITRLGFDVHDSTVSTDHVKMSTLSHGPWDLQVFIARGQIHRIQVAPKLVAAERRP